MYAKHVPILAKHARASHRNFADVVVFVLLSIRQPFTRVKQQMKEVLAAGEKSPHLFAFKRDGYQFVHGPKGRGVWERVCATNDAREAIKALMDIPGLGIAKSGFVAQIMGFDTGCIDSRNQQRLGYGKREFRADKDRPWAAQLKKYINACEGRAEELWDGWCADLAAEEGIDAMQVSAWHLAAIRKGADTGQQTGFSFPTTLANNSLADIPF